MSSVALGAEEPRRGTSGGTSLPQEPGARGQATGEEQALQQLLEQRRRSLGLPADGSPDRAAADQLAIQTKAAIHAATAFRLPDPATQAVWREQWIGTIRRRVRDPALKTCVMVKVAAAIVAGEVKASQVEEIFAELDNHRRNHTLRGPAGKYFYFAARQLFDRHGLEWTGYASGGRRKPRGGGHG